MRDKIYSFAADARASGFPPFATRVEHSTPLNSAPYCIKLDVAKQLYRNCARRTRLLNDLSSECSTIELKIAFALIGGSFLDIENDSPSDLDVILFYTRYEERSIPDLAELQMRLKRTRQLDIRLIPLDGDPLIAIKCACYFMLLYSRRTGDMVISRSPLLITDITAESGS